MAAVQQITTDSCTSSVATNGTSTAIASKRHKVEVKRLTRNGLRPDKLVAT
jgi:hypothetical protein